MADYHYSAKQSKKVKLENDEPSPTLIINQVLDFARTTSKSPKSPRELSSAFLNIRKYLNEIREEIKTSPALETLKETQELEFRVLSEQLAMKKALIDRWSKQKLLLDIDLLTEDM